MNKISFITLGIGLFIVVLFNFTLSKPLFSSIKEEADFLNKKGNFRQADKLYQNLAYQNPLDVGLQYEYIKNHFSCNNQNEKLFIHYREMSAQKDAALQDMGNYGLGLCYAFNDDIDNALLFYLKVFPTI